MQKKSLEASRKQDRNKGRIGRLHIQSLQVDSRLLLLRTLVGGMALTLEGKKEQTLSDLHNTKEFTLIPKMIVIQQKSGMTPDYSDGVFD